MIDLGLVGELQVVVLDDDMQDIVYDLFVVMVDMYFLLVLDFECDYIMVVVVYQYFFDFYGGVDELDVSLVLCVGVSVGNDGIVVGVGVELWIGQYFGNCFEGELCWYMYVGVDC